MGTATPKRPWSDLSTEEWLVLTGIAHNPMSWGEAVPTGEERREGDFGPEWEVLHKLRDRGLIDYVAPGGRDDFATCTLTERGRQALEARRHR